MNDTAATANAEQVPFLQEKTILATAGIVLVKWITVATLKVGEKVVVINGFFDFVHWRNPGAAWSILEGKSFFLAIVSIFALWALIHFREHFEIGTRTGKLQLQLQLQWFRQQLQLQPASARGALDRCSGSCSRDAG